LLPDSLSHSFFCGKAYPAVMASEAWNQVLQVPVLFDSRYAWYDTKRVGRIKKVGKGYK